jgi:ATP-dependent Clp protease ATP-binding subunit ClpA
MNVSIAVYVEEQKTGEPPSAVHVVRPLFFNMTPERDASLQRAMGKLARALKYDFEHLAERARQDDIAARTFYPELNHQILKIAITLGHRRYECKYLFVTFEGFGRKVAFTPNVPDVWFEIGRGENLADRAVEALETYFRERERKEGKDSQHPDNYSIGGRAWISSLELNLTIPKLAPKKIDSLFALLGGDSVMSGAAELNRVGRCLDWLFPNDLDRVARRDEDIYTLTHLLEAKDKRPVLIIGPSAVGKTALIHEYVYRKVEKRRSAYVGTGNVWLLAPQRLISGMSYLGQWEKRLLAIIEETKLKEHVLYFDDLLGLFHAGQSASSTLNVAQVLKPYLERREIRVLAEITPEAFRVLQEKDRGLADIFQIIRLQEPSEDETLKILLSVMRELEHQHDCKFEFDALPTAMDLQRRYVRDAVFPGKAATFLKRLAVKRGKTQAEHDDERSAITRDDVLKEFQAASGMSVSFLDDRAKLERESVIENIGRNLIGQAEAIEAAADCITTAKARLNDSTRPLASFLFLGPTGTGKTECAKQIAAYLYGASTRLLRFDMNEFVSSYDVARLVGTFDQPEGLLTSAIRRQPFSVVLLDEIEKAHPDVFNLLLQVMSDGRLTDALGRAVDFTNAILILTSNLGAREAGKTPGFRQSETNERQIYRQSAEKFFKPEFFNRLDRVIPFERLSREDVEKIARRLMQNVFSRDGFVRRNCKLMVQEQAMEKIINQGYHPLLGARALKRAIEKQLTQPVAARLASLNANAPTIINLLPDGENISVEVQELRPRDFDERYWTIVKKLAPDDLLDRVAASLDRIEEELEKLKPRGEITVGNESQRAYVLVRECFNRLERMMQRAEDWLEREKKKSKKEETQTPARSKRHLLKFEDEDAFLSFGDLLTSNDPQQLLRDWADAALVYGEKIEDYLQDILRELSLLDAFASATRGAQTKAALLLVQTFDESGQESARWLCKLYEELFNQELGLEAKQIKRKENSSLTRDEGVIIKGVHALSLAQAERGTHLFLTTHLGFVPLKVNVIELENDIISNPQKLLSVLNQMATSKLVLNPIIRAYKADASALDFRIGLMANEKMTIRELRAFILSALPLPKEFSID